ncbi:MAG: tetratricopeptide repeat protein [Deltaproteobacteria bacterium]
MSTDGFDARSIRAVHGALTVTLVAAVGVRISVSGLVRVEGADLSDSAGALFTVAALAVLVFRFFRVVRWHNLAIVAMHAGRHDDARRTFEQIARGFHGRTIASTAVHNLAELAMRRGAFEEAVKLARARLAFSPDKGPMHDLAEQQLAFSLACAGSTDESLEHARACEHEEASVEVRAGAALTRALAAFRAGRYADAQSTLSSSRTLLRTTLTGWAAALAVAMEAGVLERLDGAYRAGATAPSGLPYSASTRKLVASVLPGSEAWLGSR